MKSLIVNADDFGFTRGVNAGIIRAFTTGIVTSASIMANGAAFEDAVEQARANPGLGVGCHLVIVGGRAVASVSEIPTLAGRRGELPDSVAKLAMRLMRIPAEEIRREFRAQIGLVTRAGIRITHLDTHKHAHVHPKVMRALAGVAVEFGIRCVRNPFESVFGGPRARRSWTSARQCALSMAIAPAVVRFRQLTRKYGLRAPARVFGMHATGTLDAPVIRGVMRSLDEGTAELMCHPGFYDDDLERASTRLKVAREQELAAVSDPALKQLARDLGITLISFRELGLGSS